MSELSGYLSDLKALLEVAKELSPTLPSPAERLAELKEMISLVRGLDPTPPPAPTPASSGTWQGVAERAIAAIERAAEIRAGAGAPPAAPAPGGKIVRVPKWTAPALQYVPMIVTLADRAGLDPGAAADAIAADPAAAEKLVELAPLFARDGFPSDLVNAIPELKERAAWVTPFLFALKGKLPSNGALAPAAHG